MDDYIYYRQLPAKRMASGALFFDAAERFLILRPNYKKTWEIPGGVVEKDESPIQACVREVKEELDLVLDPANLPLLCLQYSIGDSIRTESLMFIFNGGFLNRKQISNLHLGSEELIESRFMTLDESKSLLSPTLWERVKNALQARRDNRVFYFETAATC